MAPLRVPGWFKGAPVGATAKKTVSVTAPLVTNPTVVRLNVGGTKSARSSCGCQPPDTNGAINNTNIVEAVNLSLTVYKRGGALVKRTPLASLLGTSRSLSDPRIQWDNVGKRWILALIPIPATTSTTPQMFVAVSKTASATGAWWVYLVSFSGGLFPSGTLLDYPMLGQDRNVAIVGSNNFQLDSAGNFNYINSSVIAFPKSALYTGGGFSAPAFQTAFSTHPSVPKGLPMKAYPRTYLVAANATGGYNLYYLANTAGTPTYTLQGTTANSLWSPPPPANQPSPFTGNQLDTLDGRLQAPPIQADAFVWFTHAVSIGGFPGVRYGALNEAGSGTGGVGVTSADAYASGTSDDWNPSIALSELTTNSDRIFLGWAMTDPTAGTNVSTRVSGVGPGEGVPSLAGIGTTVFTGSGSSSQSRFGDFSSVTMDVANVSTTCKWNTQSLVVNEVFNAGSWQVRLVRIGSC